MIAKLLERGPVLAQVMPADPNENMAVSLALSALAFAITLIMGIAASMITAVFITRTFFLIWLERKPAMSTLSI